MRVIFEAVLQPAAGEDSVEAVAQHFRTAIKRNRTEVHIVDRLVLDPSMRIHGVCRGYRAEDACRACQRLCGLRPRHDAGCADCRSGTLLSLPQLKSSLELNNLQGMGSPATADEADDSYQTLGVGRSLPGSHYTRH